MKTHLTHMPMYTVGEGIRLYNTCCIEGAKQHIPDRSVDLLIADPPFAIGEEKFTTFYNRYKESIIPGYIPAPEDYYHFSLDWMIQAYRVLKEHGSMYVVSGWTNGHIVQTALLKIGFVLINEIIWQYNFPVFTKNKYNSAHYRIYYCKKSKKAKPTFNKHCRFTADEKDQHGRSVQYHDMSSVWYTKKEFHRGRRKNINKLPGALVSKMLAYSSNRQDLIFDPFLGNGTTALQAFLMQRRIIGFEKNPKAYQYIIAQLESKTSGSTKTFLSHAGNSATSETWTTPKELLEPLYTIFGTFDLDPCSPTSNGRTAPVRAKVHYTQEDNGLSLPWFGTVFLNPPYGRSLHSWTAKAKAEVEQGNAQVVVALLPARPDTSYWHRDIAGSASVFFLKGRLKFGGTKQVAPFPSCLVLWGASNEVHTAIQAALPGVWLSR